MELASWLVDQFLSSGRAWLRRLGLLPLTADARVRSCVHVTFAVHQVAVGQFFLRVFQIISVNIAIPVLCTNFTRRTNGRSLGKLQQYYSVGYVGATLRKVGTLCFVFKNKSMKFLYDCWRLSWTLILMYNLRRRCVHITLFGVAGCGLSPQRI